MDIKIKVLEFYNQIIEKLKFNWKYNKSVLIKGIVFSAAFIVSLVSFLLINDKPDIVVIPDDSQIKSDISAHNSKTDEIKDNDTEIEEPVIEIIQNEKILIYVDVAGAVTTPGVIQIEEGARVFQAVALAGGLKSNADTMNVNLAAELKDGDKIFIPTIAEVQKDKKAGGIITNKVTTNVSTSSNTLININVATSEQLQSLNGIGPSTAQKIIEFRNKYGDYKDVNDLLNVSGIGEKTLNRFKDKICV